MKTHIPAFIALMTAAAFVVPVAVMAADVVPQTPSQVVAKGQTIVTLAAVDAKQVDQDLLMASLRIELDDKEARKVQDKINKAMQQAVAVSKNAAQVKFSTGQYFVYQFDPNPSPRPLSHAEQVKRMMWKGSQQIDLQSKDSQALLDVISKIQDMSFVMNGLSYTLSPEKEEEQKDALLTGALIKIQKKAELIAKALGKTGYDIEEVNIEGANMPEPQPMMMKAMRAEMGGASDAPMAAPVAAPGQTNVTLSVSARVVLK